MPLIRPAKDTMPRLLYNQGLVRHPQPATSEALPSRSHQAPQQI
jgi:hypothetical protein